MAPNGQPIMTSQLQPMVSFSSYKYLPAQGVYVNCLMQKQ